MNGTILTPLKKIRDDRGSIMHMMRANDPGFDQFGEIYFSWINPKIVKGWHKHNKVTVNFAVPMGCVKVVIYDDRQSSETHGQFQDVRLDDEKNYKLLTIKPGLWYAFTCLGDTPAMIANCTTHPHDKSESESKTMDQIPYAW